MNSKVRIFITGDVHRTDVDRFDYYFGKIQEELQETENYLIVLGDLGVNFYNKGSDHRVKEWFEGRMRDYNMTMIAVRGNHEKRPEDISTYKLSHFIWESGSQIDGWFWTEDDFPRLLFCDNFGWFCLGETTFYQVGGAYSVDKFYRLRMGRTWIENEQLSDQEMENVKIELNNLRPLKVDYVLSHTCPISWEPTHLFLSGLDQSTVDKTMEHFLEYVKGDIQYKKWFFGHYHADEIINDKAEMLYRGIKELV